MSPIKNKNWVYSGVSFSGQEYPSKKEARDNYFIFIDEYLLEQMDSGKMVKGAWEYMPYGKLIVLYYENKSIYIPARIAMLSQSELWLQIFSLELTTTVITKYKACSI